MSDRHPTAKADSGYSKALDWSVVAAAGILAGLQLYDGLESASVGNAPTVPPVLLGVLLLAGIGLFFTDYWDSVLFLPGAAVGLYVFVVWLFAETNAELTGLMTAASAALLAVLCLVNLYFEEVATLRDRPPRGPKH